MKQPESKDVNASPRLALVSLESYSADGPLGKPKGQELITTGVIAIVFLIASEHFLRFLFASVQHWHPILQVETNRMILARHLGVDALSCFIVTFLGWDASKTIGSDMIDAIFRGNRRAVPVAFENRVFKYHPESLRLTLFFFAYQIKNTYDTLIWNDGPEFVAHHILTILTAWGALAPGSMHYYALFYFGVSEVSTAVLCILANFDEIHGVPGLAEAFPVAKAVIGFTFAGLFILCRVFLWTNISYYYCRDAWNVLSTNDPRLQGRRTWLRYTFVSLALLSLLQIVWLGEIARVARLELEGLGLL
eukprot:Nitzschia sp. Nitz4//scaffold250_size28497//16634//17659//NITZ4_008126-RA/size28497-processed-gene-0.13-mRNA-1//1//CDS//3329544219//3326//frame0